MCIANEPKTSPMTKWILFPAGSWKKELVTKEHDDCQSKPGFENHEEFTRLFVIPGELSIFKDLALLDVECLKYGVPNLNSWCRITIK